MNDKTIWDFLIEKLHNPYGVAGLMGNLYVESRLDPTLLEGKYAREFGMTSAEYTTAVDNGTYTNFINDHAGYGLAQWTYWSRKESLLKYAQALSSSIGDLDMQLNFLWQELQSYKTVVATLYSAKSVREASDVVVLRYEKPKNTGEEFLRNRANYGQKYLDKFGGDIVNTWAQVDAMLTEWLAQGLKKPEIVVKLANACLGWNYIYGDRGEKCTPSHVKSRISSLAKNYPAQSENLKKKCQITNGSGKTNCDGCKFYPDGVTLAYDCRGFTYWCFLKGAGIEIVGGGATTQYNNNANWEEKGEISKMPKDKVCCVFRKDNSTGKMEHTLIFDGNGHYIHDSTFVKKCDVSQYKATHYAIPKGLYGGVTPVVICQAKVIASSGSTVNMRASKSTSAAVVARVPVGTIIDVTEKGDTWCGVQYGGKNGYMMTKFLDFNITPSGDTVTVKRSDLETIYAMIGSMLGK